MAIFERCGRWLCRGLTGLTVLWLAGSASAALELREALRIPLERGQSAQKVSLPDVWAQAVPPRSGAWRYRIELPRRAWQFEPALFIPKAANSFDVRVNGERVVLVGGTSHPYPEYGNEPQLIQIPLPLLDQRDAILEIDVYGERHRGAGLSEVMFGERAELEPRYSAAVWSGVRVPWMIATSCLLMGSLALLVWWRNRDYALGLFAAGSLAWGVRATFLLIHAPLLSPALWQYLYFVLHSLYLCPLALFILHVIGVHSRQLRRGIMAYLWLTFVVCAAAVMTEELVIRTYWLIGAIAIALSVSGLAVVQAWRQRGEEAIAVAVVSALSAGAGLRDWWVIQYQDAGFSALTWQRYVALAYMMMQVWILAVRYARTTAELGNMNQMLEGRVAEREAEIARLYRQERERERNAAAQEERTRIMREMHDGVGGRLAAAVAVAGRSGVPDEVRNAIQESLTELRLALDVSGSAIEDLNTALATLRHRIEPTLRAAGYQLRWNVEALSDEQDSPSPSMALHVLRIVQEAIANAMKHSGGNQIGVEARRDVAGRRLVIAVRNNGRGFNAAPPVPGTPDRVGRGLANMHYRAQALGGRLRIDSLVEGTTVQLELPLPGATHPIQPD